MKDPLLLLGAVLLALLPLSAAGEGKRSEKKRTETDEPAWMRHVTRVPPGPFAELRPIQLQYNLSWKNTVKAGEMVVTIVPTSDENGYVGNATGQSTGLARALFPYDFEAVSRIDAGSLRPLLFVMSETQRKSRASYEIEFLPNRAVFRTTKQNTETPGAKPVSRKSGFRHDFTQDLLSAVFYLRSQPLDEGDRVSLVVAPQNRAYLAQARVAGREPRRVKGRKYDTIRLDLGVAKIGNDLSLQPYSKIESATVWITDDKDRLPLELQAEIFIGFISARLSGKKWLRE